jgi:long-chain acyl-CoA synthetase
LTTLSLAAVLAEAARRHSRQGRVVDAGTRATYDELWQQARSYAAGLRELGIGPGDTVAMLIPNVLDFPRVYYAALAVGATIVPVHLLLTAEEMAYVLRDSGTDMLIAHSSQLALGAAAAHAAGNAAGQSSARCRSGWPTRRSGWRTRPPRCRPCTPT